MDGDIDLNLFRRRLRKHGQSADARVLEVEVSKWQSADSSLTREYLLEVQPVGEQPFQARVKDAFSTFWAPKRGDLLKVKFDPRSHKVAFDLEGDPRYDASLQKQRGQWTPGEASPPSIIGTGSRGEVESAPGAAGERSAVDRLQQLGQLRDAGLITPEDFEAQKLRILESL